MKQLRYHARWQTHDTAGRASMFLAKRPVPGPSSTERSFERLTGGSRRSLRGLAQKIVWIKHTNARSNAVSSPSANPGYRRRVSGSTGQSATAGCGLSSATVPRIVTSTSRRCVDVRQRTRRTAARTRGRRTCRDRALSAAPMTFRPSSVQQGPRASIVDVGVTPGSRTLRSLQCLASHPLSASGAS